MRSRSWLPLLAGFGMLILLIGLLGFGAMHRAQELYDESAAASEAYMQTDAVLRDIPSDLYLWGILIRDYLLDPSHLMAPAFHQRMLDRRAALQRQLDVLAQRFKNDKSEQIRRLRDELETYRASMDPLLTWSPGEKASLGRYFLRQQVLPRREIVVSMARRVSQLNAEDLRREQLRLRENQLRLQGFLRTTVAYALAFGFLIALVTVARVIVLERRGEQDWKRAEGAEAELRRLSRNLVSAQEEERRHLSRELHDAVGQMLSAMTMELKNLESSLDEPDKLRNRLEEARRLNADTIRGVRDLAMGLRPSMLDELGLGPALRWQGRDFSRRSGVPVAVQIDGDLDGLSDAHRTCIFRIVQEALTNCSRHAHASQIRIAVYGAADRVRLSVQDDGAGFQRNRLHSGGLGLLGIEERARALEGSVSITSQPGKGTILEVELPIAAGAAAE
jgi:signal transduction histidine kinase